jgi:glycerophosphoryl diester phosphodiesterase
MQMRTELHGHRGARGLAPENTLSSFREAIANGVDFIEIDVGMSRDDKVVIHHDRSLSPAATRLNGQWIDEAILIRSMSAAQLKAFDVGHLKPGTASAENFPQQRSVDRARIPLLSELFELPELVTNPDISLNVEIKTSPDAITETASPHATCDALLQEIDTYGFRYRSRIQSFDWRNLVYLKSISSDLSLGFLTHSLQEIHRLQSQAQGACPWYARHDFESTAGAIPAAIKKAGGAVWGPHFEAITPIDVQNAHALGLKVVVWTVNEPADIREMLALGVDGITTDYPDRARHIIDSWPGK